MVAIIIIIFVVALILIWGIATNNNLVTLKNRVKNAWAQIEVNLKRRFDLIPNLVNTVKGYASHESETLEKVIEARNKFVSAKGTEQQMEANNQLSQTLGHLFALSESYPDLKANQNFIDLQNQLKETEDKIAFTRQFYNDTAMKYNTAIMKFPASIIAGMFHFTEEPYFSAGEEAQKAPEVKF